MLLYYNNIYPKWDKKPELEVINLFTGIKTIIKISESLTNQKLNSYLCDTFDIKILHPFLPVNFNDKFSKLIP